MEDKNFKDKISQLVKKPQNQRKFSPLKNLGYTLCLCIYIFDFTNRMTVSHQGVGIGGRATGP